ncbi:hypothetical protein SteCoe_25730 [Stentor coeruleus]|uniref:Uncharacterized protein n=1 Tax=Stentor coeruleus TaxID=5963 RepID=A0A1R2BEL2_9CILI|nr:hypothetical protein SteCoe_25730 [Stentor coeruleus]
MGCAQTITKPTEEEAIVQAEQVLNMHTQNCSQLDITFRKFSLNGKLNALQFTRAANSLGVVTKNIGNFTRVTTTYNRLKDYDGNFLLINLIVIGILLGKESKETKAQILYQCMDNELLGYLYYHQVKNLIDLLAKHSVDTLGGLVCDGQNPYSSELRNTKYLFDLNSVRKDVVEKISDFIMIGLEKVKEADFIERLVFYCEGRILRSTGFREILYCEYIASIPKKQYINSSDVRRAFRKTVSE